MLALVSMVKMLVMALVGRIILVDFGLVDNGDVVGDFEDCIVAIKARAANWKMENSEPRIKPNRIFL